MEIPRWKIYLGVAIVGIILGIVGVRDRMISSVSKAEPQTISCADLANKGPGDKTLSRFLPETDNLDLTLRAL